MLPPSIQVCPVELPGRGRRSEEPAISDVVTLADQLAAALPLQVSSLTARGCADSVLAALSLSANRLLAFCGIMHSCVLLVHRLRQDALCDLSADTQQ